MPLFNPSGSVATDPIWDVKGDTVAATGPDAATRIPVGADGLIQGADSTNANGVAWRSLNGTIRAFALQYPNP